jgi:hypothetical protein
MTLDQLPTFVTASRYFCGLFNDANGIEYHTSMNEGEIDELESIWSEVVVAY